MGLKKYIDMDDSIFQYDKKSFHKIDKNYL